MTSVIKTVYTLQPPSVLSGGLPAGGYPYRPPSGPGDQPGVVRPGNVGRGQGDGISSALTTC